MTMFYIILLIVLGLLFLVAELVLLPGVSIGAILALVCYGSSIYLYEAKSLTAYVDPRREVEVVGFENFSVIVKTVKDRHA